ncbi:MAG: hypothetical protein AAFQ64_04910 [Pseudomonadota bacterium]
MAVTKVGTCCYCGTKAALVLRGEARHELSCQSCGAPLHALKILPHKPEKPKKQKAISHRPPLKGHDAPDRPGKRKKRKSFKQKVWSEVWDALEDIFD